MDNDIILTYSHVNNNNRCYSPFSLGNPNVDKYCEERKVWTKGKKKYKRTKANRNRSQ